MTQLLNLTPSSKTPTLSSLISSPILKTSSRNQNFANLTHKLRCNGRVSCLFSDNRKQEEARKALESALGGNKEKFEKWDQEIKKREEAGGGGGNAGGGGWFGWGGRFGWSDDNFWQEAQQTSLALLGILVLYLVAAKGDLLVAIIVNPLLFALRSTRNGLTYITSLITGKSYMGNDAQFEDMKLKAVQSSAKESVMKKWGSD